MEEKRIIDDFYCEYVLSGAVEVDKVRETENVLAFAHTRPSWSYHVVVIPKIHVARLSELNNFEVVREMFEIITDIIKTEQLDQKNYKIYLNGGQYQESDHLHFHLVSGEQYQDPVFRETKKILEI